MKCLPIALALILTPHLSIAQQNTDFARLPADVQALLRNSNPLAETDMAARLRQAGLYGNRSLIPELLDVVKKREANPKTDQIRTALRSLCILGAREVLPHLEKDIAKLTEIMQNSKGLENTFNYAEVCRARLLAEAGTRNMRDDASRAKEKLRLFLGAVKLDVPEINVSTQKKTRLSMMHEYPGLAITRETMALREIADMIYRHRDKSLLALVKKQELNFDVDYASALKIRLALSSHYERVERLVNEMANLKVFTMDGYYLVQLAIDEGQDASRYATIKIREMMKTLENEPFDPQQLDVKKAGPHRMGVRALLRLICGVGDSDQAPFVLELTKSKHDYIRSIAVEAYPFVHYGIGCQYLYTY